MKVGIVTRRDGYNIGTSLQAYAMQKIVSLLNVDNLIIDYCEYSKKARIRYFVLNVLGILAYIFPNSNFRKGLLQRNKFDAFDKNLIKTKERYYYYVPSELNDCFDVFICGSDQIWNPQQVRKAFLLDFVDDDKKKIAYAPSFGIKPDVTDFDKDNLSLMSRFSFLSCREYDGMDFIEKVLDKECKLVIDPTLLVDRQCWESLSKDIPIKNDYVLCYFLGKGNIPCRAIENFAKKKNLEIVNIRMFYNSISIGNDIYSSPAEFLYLIENAKYVFTNSYHGTIFSIIYNKQFFLFSRNYSFSTYTEKSRFETLFTVLEIEKTIDSVDVDVVDEKEMIDYNRVNSILGERRAESFLFLKKSIYGDDKIM